jgi:Na+/proline symporter
VGADTLILAIVVVYMAVLLGIGAAAARVTRSPVDFFLAGCPPNHR